MVRGAAHSSVCCCTYVCITTLPWWQGRYSFSSDISVRDKKCCKPLNRSVSLNITSTYKPIFPAGFSKSSSLSLAGSIWFSAVLSLARWPRFANSQHSACYEMAIPPLQFPPAHQFCKLSTLLLHRLVVLSSASLSRPVNSQVVSLFCQWDFSRSSWLTMLCYLKYFVPLFEWHAWKLAFLIRLRFVNWLDAVWGENEDLPPTRFVHFLSGLRFPFSSANDLSSQANDNETMFKNVFYRGLYSFCDLGAATSI